MKKTRALERCSNGRKMKPLLSRLQLHNYRASVITTIIYKNLSRASLDVQVTGMILNQHVETISCKMNKFDQETWEVSPFVSVRSGFHPELTTQNDTNIAPCKPLFDRLSKIESHCLFFGNQHHIAI